MRLKFPPRLNPLLMMNRAGHRVFQQVAPGKLMHAAGGGKEPCFYIVSAEIGNPFPEIVVVCFNAEFESIVCELAGDWTFRTVDRGPYEDVNNGADVSPTCDRWSVIYDKTEGSETQTSPQDTVLLDYTPGTCHKLGESGNDDCLLAATTNFPVANRIYGPVLTRIGDIGNDIVLLTFPTPLATEAVSGFPWTVEVNGTPHSGVALSFQIVAGNLQITLPVSVSNTDVVTVTHNPSNIGQGAQAEDGRFVWEFFDMPVLNVVGVSFWNREDAGPWLLEPRGTGRWRLEN